MEELKETLYYLTKQKGRLVINSDAMPNSLPGIAPEDFKNVYRYMRHLVYDTAREATKHNTEYGKELSENPEIDEVTKLALKIYEVGVHNGITSYANGLINTCEKGYHRNG